MCMLVFIIMPVYFHVIGSICCLISYCHMGCLTIQMVRMNHSMDLKYLLYVDEEDRKVITRLIKQCLQVKGVWMNHSPNPSHLTYDTGWP